MACTAGLEGRRRRPSPCCGARARVVPSWPLASPCAAPPVGTVLPPLRPWPKLRFFLMCSKAASVGASPCCPAPGLVAVQWWCSRSAARAAGCCTGSRPAGAGCTAEASSPLASRLAVGCCRVAWWSGSRPSCGALHCRGGAANGVRCAVGWCACQRGAPAPAPKGPAQPWLGTGRALLLGPAGQDPPRSRTSVPPLMG